MYLGSQPGAHFNIKTIIGCVLVLFVLIFGTVYLIKKDTFGTPKDPSQLILGTWHEISFTKYLGFIESSPKGLLRTYVGGETVDSLENVELWTITNTTETPILHIYFYSPASDPDFDYKKFAITGLSRNRFTLTRLNSDDTLSNDLENYERVGSAGTEAKKSLSLTEAQRKAGCEEIFTDRWNTENTHKLLLPLSCTADIAPGVTADFLFASDGDLQINRNGTSIFLLSNTPDLWLPGGTGPFLKEGSFSLADVTYDGYKDLVLETSAGAYNYTYDYFAYDPKTATYNPKPILEAVNSLMDEQARTIQSYIKGRGIGDLYTVETYHFESGQYVLIGVESQDFAVADDLEGKQGYIRITKERRNGVLVEVSREKLTQEEVWGE